MLVFAYVLIFHFSFDIFIVVQKRNAYSILTAAVYISTLMCFWFHIANGFQNGLLRGDISILQRVELNSSGLGTAETVQWVGGCLKL